MTSLQTEPSSLLQLSPHSGTPTSPWSKIGRLILQSKHSISFIARIALHRKFVDAG
jgi:hypothetical protein